MISRVLQDRSHSFGWSGHLKKSRELRLAARSTMIDHHVLSDASRDCGANIFFDQRQRQIYSRGYSSRSPNAPVLDEDLIRLDDDLREFGLQPWSIPPMCGGTLAIEKSSGGQFERPRADTCYAARVKRHRGDRAGVSRKADIQHLDADNEKRIPSLSGGIRSNGNAAGCLYRRPRIRNHDCGIGAWRMCLGEAKCRQRPAEVKQL